jgi:hypothetical protein
LVTFESGSRLSRTEKWTFAGTGLIEIIIPASVEVLRERFFYECRSLSQVIFESASRLSRIVSRVSFETGSIEIVISASVEV